MKKGLVIIPRLGGGILGFFIIALFFMLLFYVVPQFNQVNYGISLQNDSIDQNSNFQLQYSIVNNLPDTIFNVSLKYEIIDTNINGVVDIIDLKKSSKVSDNILIKTSGLEKKEYRIRTILIYDTPEEHIEKQLTLAFRII